MPFFCTVNPNGLISVKELMCAIASAVPVAVRQYGTQPATSILGNVTAFDFEVVDVDAREVLGTRSSIARRNAVRSSIGLGLFLFDDIGLIIAYLNAGKPEGFPAFKIKINYVLPIQISN